MPLTPQQRRERIEAEIRRQRRRFKRNRKGSLKRAHAKEALERLGRALRAVLRQIKALAKRRPRSGTGPWGGAQSIIENEVDPILRRAGIASTSTKRTETYGNPDSDHHVSQRTAYAKDYAVAEAHALADRIGIALGIGPVTDYTHYYIRRAGKLFRVQIIAGTHGTGPHLHLGVRLVG